MCLLELLNLLVTQRDSSALVPDFTLVNHMHLFEEPLLKLWVIFHRVFDVVLLSHVCKHLVELALVAAFLHLSLGARDRMLLQEVFLVLIFEPQLVSRVNPHSAQLLKLLFADLAQCFLSLILFLSARQVVNRGGMSGFLLFLG